MTCVVISTGQLGVMFSSCASGEPVDATTRETSEAWYGDLLTDAVVDLHCGCGCEREIKLGAPAAEAGTELTEITVTALAKNKATAPIILVSFETLPPWRLISSNWSMGVLPSSCTDPRWEPISTVLPGNHWHYGPKVPK
jgi:hypothetical protein